MGDVGSISLASNYKADGFDQYGIHKDTGTKRNLQGFNKDGIHKNGTKFDNDGYDKDGWNQRGFNKNGIHKDTKGIYNKDGFNQHGYFIGTSLKGKYNLEGYDRDGYNEKGFNKDGVHKNGTKFDNKGYDKDGWNQRGFNKKGIHRDTKGIYNKEGFNKDGCFIKTGQKYNLEGYNRDGYNKEGFNKDGIHKNGTKFDNDGYDKDGWNQQGWNREGFNRDGYDKDGRNKDKKDKLGYSYVEFCQIKEKIEVLYHRQQFGKIISLLNNWGQCFILHYESRLVIKLNECIKQSLETYLKKYKYKEADQFFLEYGDYSGYSYKDYIKCKKNSIKEFFKKNNRDPNEINDEKYNILADFSQYLLVKARAGTGKTTALKYKTWFLNKAYGINPDEILVLAFNKKAAQEIGERIRNMKVGGFRTAFTFHSLAGKILARKPNRESCEVLFDDEKSDDPQLSRFVQEIFRDFSEEEKDEIFNNLYEFFRQEIDELENEQVFLSKDEYYEYVKNQSQVTLSGKIVRSKYEKWIGDFLFEHGIDFFYEPIYNIKVKVHGNSINVQYKPDFRLDKFIMHNDNKNGIILNKNVFIEFWGVVDPNSKDLKLKPDHLNEQEYVEYIDTIKKKRDWMKEKHKELIELNLGEGRWGRDFLEQRLKEELQKRGIMCQKLPKNELISKIKQTHIAKLTDKIKNFINKAKQNKLTVEDLKQIYQTRRFSDKLTIYYKFAIDIYQRYQKKLRQYKEQDFNDLLWEATEFIKENEGNIEIKLDSGMYQNLNDFKYIMIDEYQDFSLLFREIISQLKEYNPDVKVICVGDDWQLINSFAGSNIKYIQNFKNYFPGGNKLTLLQSNRCPKMILDISNKFMAGKGESAEWNKKNVGTIEGRNGDCWEFVYKKIDSSKYGIANKIQALALGRGYIKDEKEVIQIDDKIYYIVNRNNQDLAQVVGIIVAWLKKEQLYEKNFDNAHQWKGEKHKKTCSVLLRTKDFKNFSMGEISKIICNVWYSSLFDNQNINSDTEKLIRENFSSILSVQTIHKSKGQEYDIVIIPGMGSSYYPFIHPDTELDEIFGTTIQDVFEEERRLFYVALTRAKDKLYYISECEKDTPKGKLDGGRLLSLWNIVDHGVRDDLNIGKREIQNIQQDTQIFQEIKNTPIEITKTGEDVGVLKNDGIADIYKTGYLTLVQERNFLQKELSSIFQKTKKEREELLQQVRFYEENNQILKDNLLQAQKELEEYKVKSQNAQNLITAANANEQSNEKLSQKLEKVLQELGKLQEQQEKTEQEKQELQNRLEKQEENLKNIQSENENLIQQLREKEDAVKVIENKYLQISEELENAKKEGNKNLIDAIENEKQKIEEELDRIKQEKENLKKDLSEKNKELEDLNQRMKDTNKEILIKAGEIDKAEKAVLKLIKKAQRIIILIDPYIDAKTFYYLGKRKIGVKAKLHYANRVDSGILELKNDQEENSIIVRHHDKDFHDRYLIIDNQAVYHFGTSMDSHLGEKQTIIKKLSSTPQKLMESLGFNI